MIMINTCLYDKVHQGVQFRVAISHSLVMSVDAKQTGGLEVARGPISMKAKNNVSNSANNKRPILFLFKMEFHFYVTE